MASSLDVSQLDGLNHWPAILGEESGPRSEAVLNLPRSRLWALNESATFEGVALISGSHKLLLNHAYDPWFAASPRTKDFHVSRDMFGINCKYEFYSADVSGPPRLLALLLGPISYKA